MAAPFIHPRTMVQKALYKADKLRLKNTSQAVIDGCLYSLDWILHWNMGLELGTGLFDWNVGLEHYSSTSAISAIAYVLSLKL